MRLSAIFLLTPLPAFAHSGHLAASGGHDHWLAGGALIVATGIACWRMKARWHAQQGAFARSDKPTP